METPQCSAVHIHMSRKCTHVLALHEYIPEHSCIRILHCQKGRVDVCRGCDAVTQWHVFPQNYTLYSELPSSLSAHGLVVVVMLVKNHWIICSAARASTSTTAATAPETVITAVGTGRSKSS